MDPDLGAITRAAEQRELGGAAVIFQKSAVELASQPAQNLKFEREDWSLFRTVEGLQQKAGVARDKLTRLVMKEITDNGLDEGAEVRVGELSKGRGYFVEDDGAGIAGTPEEIAKLFSIARPMLSTKLLRLPTRGTLGNGLRVVAGAVLASGLSVTTCNRRIVLRPQRDGTTTVVSVKKVKFPVGTRIEISFGPALPCDDNSLCWALVAIHMAWPGSRYLGKSSPHWYDAAQFYELLYASGRTPVRELVAHLDGCSGAKAGEIVAVAGLGRALCSDVTREQAESLLTVACENARQVKPQRLGIIGQEAFPDHAYASSHGLACFDGAEIPFVVEAWAKKTEDDTDLTVCVNRTPITGEIEAARDKRDIDAFGCGLSHRIAEAPRDAQFNIWLNITTPYMPITSDGKAPNLEPFFEEIKAAVGKAVKRASRPNTGNKQSQKDVVLDNLDAAIAKVSGGARRLRFNIRQLLYALRPVVKSETGEDLTTANFSGIITDYEAEHGEIPLMYREPRGTLYHPHRGETITLGTLMVEEYERPVWTYNKLVYIEKEGFSEASKAWDVAKKIPCANWAGKCHFYRPRIRVQRPQQNGLFSAWRSFIGPSPLKYYPSIYKYLKHLSGQIAQMGRTLGAQKGHSVSI
jgi:hypothetical protein